MHLYNIFFSPTGGTERVAGILAKTISKRAEEVDLSDRETDFSMYSFQKEDLCLIAVPSYGGRVPEPAVERIRKMRGNGAKAVLVVVYGNRAYDDTFAELQDIVKEAGFVCVAAVAAIAEHSIMRQFASGRPDQDDQKQLTAFAETLREKWKTDTFSEEPKLPGNRPYRAYGGVPMKPKVKRSCNTCGRCAAQCPVGAIPKDHPDTTDTEICISCMRCIAVCPRQARYISRLLLAAGSGKLKKVCSERKENELFL